MSAAGTPLVCVETAAEPLGEGLYLLAKLSCDEFGLENASLVLLPEKDAIGLVAPCGCSVSVSLQGLMRGLQATMARSKGCSSVRSFRAH